MRALKQIAAGLCGIALVLAIASFLGWIFSTAFSQRGW